MGQLIRRLMKRFCAPETRETTPKPPQSMVGPNENSQENALKAENSQKYASSLPGAEDEQNRFSENPTEDLSQPQPSPSDRPEVKAATAGPRVRGDNPPDQGKVEQGTVDGPDRLTEDEQPAGVAKTAGQHSATVVETVAARLATAPGEASAPAKEAKETGETAACQAGDETADAESKALEQAFFAELSKFVEIEEDESSAQPIIKRVPVVSGDADSPISHPALCRTSSRRVILAYQQEQADGRSVIKIVHSDEHGLSWSQPEDLFTPELWPEEAISFTNPVMQPDQVTGRLFITASVHQSKDPQDIRIGMALSDDQGDTFRYRDVTSLVNGDQGWLSRATTPGHGIQLRNGIWTGRLVQPAVVVDADHKHKAVVVCSDDQGISWWAGKALGEGVLACGITELDDGTIVLSYLCDTQLDRDETDRDNQAAKLQTVVSFASDDGGRTFQRELELHRCEAVSGTLSHQLERAFISAPFGVEQGKVQLLVESAQPSRIHASLDQGETWETHLDLLDGEIIESDLVSLEDTRLAVLAFQTEQDIEVCLFRLDDLGLKALATGWNASKEEQDKLLDSLDFLNS